MPPVKPPLLSQNLTLGFGPRVVAEFDEGVLCASEVPDGIPEGFEASLTDFCHPWAWFGDGVLEWLAEWFDAAAIEAFEVAVWRGDLWKRRAPFIAPAFLGAVVVYPTLLEIDDKAWSGPARLRSELDLPPAPDSPELSGPITVDDGSMFDRLVQPRLEAVRLFASDLVKGDWWQCPHCEAPWDEDELCCLEGCWVL